MVHGIIQNRNSQPSANFSLITICFPLRNIAESQFYDTTTLMSRKQPPQSPFRLVPGKKGAMVELNNIMVWDNNMSGWEACKPLTG